MKGFLTNYFWTKKIVILDYTRSWWRSIIRSVAAKEILSSRSISLPPPKKIVLGGGARQVQVIGKSPKNEAVLPDDKCIKAGEEQESQSSS